MIIEYDFEQGRVVLPYKSGKDSWSTLLELLKYLCFILEISHHKIWFKICKYAHFMGQLSNSDYIRVMMVVVARELGWLLG